MSDQSSSLPHIVVVEDDMQMLTFMVELLRAAGYAVTGATTYEEARHVLACHAADLLITDVRLGAHNGLQLLVRARSAATKMPVIVVTGFADPVIQNETERLDGVYFEKPVDPRVILTAVSEMLRKRS